MYKTKIGFGLEISGEGESIGEIRKDILMQLCNWMETKMKL
ncbi:Hypothetical protein ACI5QN_01663 [Bacillus cereus]